MERIARRLVAASVLVLVLGTTGGVAGASVAPLVVTRFDDPAPNGCNPGDCSLREAIIAANAADDADSIDLQTGTYLLQLPGTDDDAAVGDLDIVESLTITGQGAAATTVDGNGAVTGDRVFQVVPISAGDDPLVTISNLTIRGGISGTGRALRSGAASRVTLSGVLVTQNTGTGSFGAIYNQNVAVMTIVDSAVIDNDTTGAFGAGVANENGATMTIRRTTIAGNDAADGYGGGVFNQNEGNLTIEDSTISNNSVPEDGGGGLFLQNTSMTTITNTTISGNRSHTDGGGLYLNNDATLVLASSTVTQNAADVDGSNDGDGGGIFVATSGTPSVTIRNSVVAENTDPTSDPDCDGTITSAHHTLVGAVSPGCSFPAGAGNVTGTPAAPVDPELGQLADNGGPTLTHALLKGSGAIDTADPATSPPFDQRGAPRSPDIGAYELVDCRNVVVNRVGTTGDDVLTGTGGKDGFLAQGGDDLVKGLGGTDAACLGGGDDTANGGGGRDTLLGQAGNDTLKGGGGPDILICGGGKKDSGKGGGGKDSAKGCEKGKA